MFNPNQQMIQAHLFSLEQNVAMSNFVIQQLRLQLGLPSQYQQAPQNPIMGMGAGHREYTFGQHQRQDQRMNPTSWIIGIEVNPNNPQELRITQAALGQQQTASTVLNRDDFMKFVSNSGMTGQVIAGHIAATAHIRSELMAWELTESQTLLTVPGVGSALFDTSFVKALPNVRIHDIRLVEKPKEEVGVITWINAIRPSQDENTFAIDIEQIGSFETDLQVGLSLRNSTAHYQLNKLEDLATNTSEIVAIQISKLVAEGGANANIVSAWRIGPDAVLISVKFFGITVLNADVINHLHESIEVVDLRSEEVKSPNLTDLLYRHHWGQPSGENITSPTLQGMESGISRMQMVEEVSEPTIQRESYNPENTSEKYGELTIDDVIYVGTTKTTFHQQFKFTFSRPQAGKLELGVKPELLDKFISNECTPITNRGLSVIIGKQNKLPSSDPKKSVFTLITFKDSDTAIIQTVGETTRSYSMSKFELARMVDKITDDAYIRQIHVE